MIRRLVGLCLLAYPRAVRARDGEHLRGLAAELAADHGILREAFGLVRGGLAERRRQSRTRRAVVAVGAATFVALTALTWTATAQGGRVEEEVFTCSARCADAEAEVASRVVDGWSCTERRQPAGVTWRCVLG